jgi:hypothetical protein
VPAQPVWKGRSALLSSKAFAQGPRCCSPATWIVYLPNIDVAKLKKLARKVGDTNVVHVCVFLYFIQVLIELTTRTGPTCAACPATAVLACEVPFYIFILVS